MAKCLIQNALGNVVFNNYVPMSAANAATFAGKYLVGSWKVLEAELPVGTDNAIALAYDAKVFVKNSTTGVNGYLNMIVKQTVSDTDIKAALTGLNINGALIDHVSIISFSPISFA